MKLSEGSKTTILVALILAGGVIAIGWWDWMRDDLRLQRESYAVEIAALRADRQTLDLAREFGFDPIIVQITQQLSRDVFRRRKCDNCTTWRIVDSDKELAYLMLSLIQVESGGNPRAYNPSGATGLAQLMYSTALSYDKRLKREELFTIPKNLRIAVEHFVDLLEKYDGNSTLALLAYNQGSGAVDRSLSFGESPENGYSLKVFQQAALRNAEVLE